MWNMKSSTKKLAIILRKLGIFEVTWTIIWINFILFCVLVLVVVITLSLRAATTLTVENLSTILYLEPTENGLKLSGIKGSGSVLHGTLGIGRNFKNISCLGDEECRIGNYTVGFELEGTDGFKIRWELPHNSTEEFRDCFDFEDGVQWYGGPERKKQIWPIQKMKISSDRAYVLRQDDNFAIAERYWLNSKGAFIYIDPNVPLFVDQNMSRENEVCFIAKTVGPYIERKRNFLEYVIALKYDPKEAHMFAVEKYLGKPTGHPDPKMISEPIWTTWAKYKTLINDSTVVEFAKEIRKNGFEQGQLEIDDNWETCYGAQEFSTSTFPNIGNTVSQLKSLNFRVSLWVHPFVNNDCQNNAREGLAKGYFVRNTANDTRANWWNGDNAYQIDFTNPEAVEWWSARLKKLQKNPGIDSFKFDAGETDYGPQPSQYDISDPETIPNILSRDYVRACSKFGPFVEIRSGSRTQDLPVLMRMIDKDSNWGESDGLYTLITTLLQMNLNGYTMVLPDMIGGNGYGTPPTPELLVRWTQANTFMPAMQFSYAPWEIKSDKFDVLSIVQKYVKLHKKYASSIIKAMENCIEKGTPVNPPIWWIDPTDATALACDDEFLLGEEILVAPVIKEGATSRNVYLPKGNWTDGNNGTSYEGPITLDYPADISVLPYFILSN